ncbi:hypothetical protein CAEBREN_10248 [Caenorhabditis brenneri]|uniref:Uncharacterized protein n=1 Tax=Caenorhabditis brenneri TaxID=135651 RepID=G0NHI5_CAEBE|nr:hypothetical protein CAEBREN_10248 [Caenorhabditis brenneri]
MCSSRVLFLLLASIAAVSDAGVTCDLSTQPATWTRVLAQNVFFNAYEPDNYFSTPGFCVNTTPSSIVAKTLLKSSGVNLTVRISNLSP